MISSVETQDSRVPPQNVEAEVAVLGSVLLAPEAAALVIPLLRAEDFYRGEHQIVYDAIVDLYDETSTVDVILLRDALRAAGTLERVGGEEFLAYLGGAVPSAASAEHYARIVRDRALKRSILRASHEVIRAVYEGAEEAADVLDFAESTLFALDRDAQAGAPARIHDLLRETMAEIDAAGEAVTGVATGFYDLDDKTSGLQRSELIVIAGRPSMGKTSFALNCVLHAALFERTAVAVFSLEMAKKQVVRNMLCMHARINATHVRRGILSENELQQLSHALGPLSESQIFIDDTPALSVTQLRAKARRLKSQHDIGMIVVDYLQLMEVPRAENRQQEISVISRSMKALARELDVPVVALSQLNRSVDAREDHRPRMSDLRESGAIEQDADVILFLFREEYYERRDDNVNQAEVIVAKQRNGPTGTAKLRFESSCMRFDNLTYEMES